MLVLLLLLLFFLLLLCVGVVVVLCVVVVVVDVVDVVGVVDVGAVGVVVDDNLYSKSESPRVWIIAEAQLKLVCQQPGFFKYNPCVRLIKFAQINVPER